MKNERFVPIPNLFLSDCPEKLTTDELRIYYVIVQNEAKWFDETTKITINQIASEVSLKKDEYQNKNRIKDILIELKKKEAIFFDDLKLSFPTAMTITFKPIEYYTNLTGFKRGYEMIPFSVFDMAKNSEEFYVLCLILKNKSGEIAYSTYATLLGICGKSAKTLIQNMNEAGLINKVSGIHYLNEANQVRQEINKYSIREQDSEKLALESAKIIQFPITQEPSTDLKDSVYETEIAMETDWGNWDKKKHGGMYCELTENDCYLYYSQKDNDEKFKLHCEKRLSALKKTKFHLTLMKWERSAKEKISRKKNQVKEALETVERASELNRVSKEIKNRRSKVKPKKSDEFNVLSLIDDEDNEVEIG